MSEYEKIVNYIILNSYKITRLGLYHGKMGIALALYAYASRYDKKHVGDFAWDMLQDVYKNVHDNMPIGLEFGLAGIGYGVTALKRQGLFDCDLNDVLSDVDSRIMLFDPRRMKDLSYRAGMLGVWNYINFRRQTEPALTSIDGMFLRELDEQMRRSGLDTSILQPKDVFADLNKPSWSLGEHSGKDFGIDGGMAYYLLNLSPS